MFPNVPDTRSSKDHLERAADNNLLRAEQRESEIKRKDFSQPANGEFRQQQVDKTCDWGQGPCGGSTSVRQGFGGGEGSESPRAVLSPQHFMFVCLVLGEETSGALFH